MNPPLYVILLMIGAIQGIVLGSMLFFQKNSNRRANRILAILLFFMAYRLLVESGISYGIGSVHHWSYHLLFEYNWIYGTLIFFYVKSIVFMVFYIKKKDTNVSLFDFYKIVCSRQTKVLLNLVFDSSNFGFVERIRLTTRLICKVCRVGLPDRNVWVTLTPRFSISHFAPDYFLLFLPPLH